MLARILKWLLKNVDVEVKKIDDDLFIRLRFAGVKVAEWEIPLMPDITDRTHRRSYGTKTAQKKA